MEPQTSCESPQRSVYTDLGYADAAEMQRKAQLGAEIARAIKARRLTQQGAAALLGVDQSKVSRITRGQFRGVSEAKLLELVTKLGHDVKIVVGPVRRRTRQDRTPLRLIMWVSAAALRQRRRHIDCGEAARNLHAARRHCSRRATNCRGGRADPNDAQEPGDPAPGVAGSRGAIRPKRSAREQNGTQ